MPFTPFHMGPGVAISAIAGILSLHLGDTCGKLPGFRTSAPRPMKQHIHALAQTHFHAARRLDAMPQGHPARRRHGHRFRVRLRVAGEEDCEGARVRLAEAAVALDYQDLDQLLEQPEDTRLARWLGDRLDRSSPFALDLASTPFQGLTLDGGGVAHYWRRYRFEAAHRLPNVPEGHKCGRMHGHGFEVILHARADARPSWMQHSRIDGAWTPLGEQLHHACLNDLPGLENPTSEMLSLWLWKRLSTSLEGLSWITVRETANAGCHYDGKDLRIWKEQDFESALTLKTIQDGIGQRRLHGHSYRIRLHLTAPLDAIYGWTVDYGDVKALFKPIYTAIDHYRLDHLDGIEDATAANIAGWIRERMGQRLPQLDRIDLFETPDRGVLLSWSPDGPALPA